MLVDTHAHIQWPSLEAEHTEVIARARAVGISHILTLGTTLTTCRAALALAESHDELYVAVGLHPCDVPRTKAELNAALTEIESLSTLPQVVAIGETGIDYYHADNPPREMQIASCIRHFELAERQQKPICLHNREATDDVMALVERYAGRVTAVLHCYTGDQATMTRAVTLGCYISFAGNVTYPKLKELLAVAAAVPADRLLLETDAPFLAPQPVRGRRNEPSSIIHTYDAVASARGLTRDECGALVSINAARLFAWERNFNPPASASLPVQPAVAGVREGETA